MNIFAISGSILAAAAGLAIVVLGYVADKETRLAFRRAALIAGVLIFVSSLLSLRGQILDAREQARIAKVQIEQGQELRVSQNEMLALQTELNDFTTGGDSLLYLDFALVRGTRMSQARLMVVGDDPARDILVTATDLTRLESSNQKHFQARLRESRRTTTLNTVWPSDSKVWGKFPYSGELFAKFRIEIQCSGRKVIQFAASRRLQSGYSQMFAYRVFHDLGQTPDGKSQLREITELRKVDENYPLDGAGKVEWLDYIEQNPLYEFERPLAANN